MDRPTRKLSGSAIPPLWHDRLGYRNVTAEEAHQLTGYCFPGWAVPYLDLKGQPYTDAEGRPFHRLRPVPALKGDDAPKYLTPRGSGCRPYFSSALKLKEKPREIDFTEGELKADCACVHGFPTIGLAGVSAWQDKRSGQSQPLPELEALDLVGVTCRVAFDSDVISKPAVQGQLVNLCQWLSGKGAYVLITQLPHAFDGTRWGIDDLIHACGVDAYAHLRRIARPAFKGKEFVWTPEPARTHHKAVMAAAAMRPFFAIRPCFGLYRWAGKCWELQNGKVPEALIHHLHTWMDHMDWQSRSAATMGAVRAELQSRLTVETGWESPHLMAFFNGTLDTRNNHFACHHDRAHLLTSALPFPYDTSARCPRWLAFLDSALVGGSEVIGVLRAAFRWSLRPKGDNPRWIEKSFDCEGRKGSGKGTTMEVLQAMAGGTDGAAGILRPSQLGNPAALFGLKGKRIALDPDSSGHIGDIGVLNAVIANETLQIKRLYHDPIDTRLGVVLWRFFNDQPTVSGGGQEGLGRRIIPLRFERRGSIDTSLKGEVLAEVAGIFQWAWTMGEEAMYRALDHAGEVAAVRELAVEQALERDVVLRFLLDTFPDGTPCITPAALFDKFKAWCAAEQHQPRSGTWFGREVKKVPAVECQRTGAARGYRIAPMRDFDTAAHLGVADPQGDGFDPTRHEPVTDRSPQEPIPSLASDPLVTGMTGLITEKGRPEKEGEKGIGKGAVSSSMRANPSHAPQPVTPNLKPAAAQGVSGNGLSDRSKFQTRHPSPIAVDGQPGWTLPGVLPKGDAPSVNVTVIDPQGKSHLIRRSRITPLPASLCA